MTSMSTLSSWSKSADLEDKEALKRRIDKASNYVPLERLAISPQCGFASVAGGNELGEDEQMRKLALVVEVARDTWGEAWIGDFVNFRPLPPENDTWLVTYWFN